MMTIITLAALVYLSNHIRLPWWAWLAILVGLISTLLGQLIAAGAILTIVLVSLGKGLAYLCKTCWNSWAVPALGTLEKGLASPKLDFIDAPAPLFEAALRDKQRFENWLGIKIC